MIYPSVSVCNHLDVRYMVTEGCHIQIPTTQLPPVVIETHPVATPVAGFSQ